MSSNPKFNDTAWQEWYSALQALASKHKVSVADKDAWYEPFEEGQSAEDAFFEEYQEHRPKEACSKKQHVKSCRECPWRRESMPGWLGASEPGEFLLQSDQGSRMPCHLAVDYDKPDWEQKAQSAPQCAGHAIYLSNRCKTAAPGVLKLPADTATIFQWPHEFVAHHAGLPQGSLAGVMVYELYDIKREPLHKFKFRAKKVAS